MLTEKDYCDYETCVALREVGYKVPTSAYYMPNNNQLIFVSNPYRGGYVIDCFYSHNSLRENVMTHDFIDAPTMWEAQKWLREEKSVIIVVYPYSYNLLHELHTWTYEIWLGDNLESQTNNLDYYEEALSEGVRTSIKILQDEQKENN